MLTSPTSCYRYFIKPSLVSHFTPGFPFDKPRAGRLKLKKVFKVFFHFLGTFIDSLDQLIDMSQADELVEVGAVS